MQAVTAHTPQGFGLPGADNGSRWPQLQAAANTAIGALGPGRAGSGGGNSGTDSWNSHCSAAMNQALVATVTAGQGRSE